MCPKLNLEETCIDEITFDENGYMQITPTLEGVGPVFVKGDEPQPEPTLESIELSGDMKTEYELGEALDLSGLTVTAVYSDGSRNEIQAGEGGYTVSGYDPDIVGLQTVTITYGGEKVTFTVTVAEKEEPGDLSEPSDPSEPSEPTEPSEPSEPSDPGQSSDTYAEAVWFITGCRSDRRCSSDRRQHKSASAGRRNADGSSIAAPLFLAVVGRIIENLLCCLIFCNDACDDNNRPI